VKFLSHPRVETRISHTAKNRNCAVSLVRNIGSNTDAVYIYTYMGTNVKQTKNKKNEVSLIA
jgi:hypothetical protein